LIRTYPILAASGRLGPKLKEGDRQVPEGLYRIESLNPNSMFHLSLRLNYPNEFDRKQARLENRTNLGGDIMIHGSNASIGCLAMGDEAAEDLFILAAETGIDKVTVVLSPVDFRKKVFPKVTYPLPEWTGILYEQIKQELSKLTDK
jgi:murein L,D-transpeptidase YafK